VISFSVTNMVFFYDWNVLHIVSLPFTKYSDMVEASIAAQAPTVAEVSTAAVPLAVITPSREKLDIVTWTS